MEQFKEKMNKKCPQLTELQLEQFEKYKNLLLEWNEKINLTAITEEDDIILKHFVDSMTILKYIEECKTIVDVGTGAGFPGIPVKIANAGIDVTLVDSLNKRLLFLEDVISNLDLKQIKTVHSRAEEFGQNKMYREKFDVATSRAVANLSVLVEYLLPLVKVGGKCICMKGSEIEEELKNSKEAIKTLGGEIERVEEFALPGSDIKRNIIVIKKIKQTSNKYPRKPGVPSKKPL
jgi:16S rRNA (guanine527-N7)-methyltransferase